MSENVFLTSVVVSTILVIIAVDVLWEWKSISLFFRYHLWEEKEVDLATTYTGRLIPVIRVSDSFYLAAGIFGDSLDVLYGKDEGQRYYQFLSDKWYISPISYTCLRIMKHVHYRQLYEAQRLIDL